MALELRKNEDGVEVWEQSEEDQAVVKMIQRRFKYAKEYQDENYTQEWNDCLDAYKGEFFKEDLPDYKAQEISNYVFSTVETILPIMTENKPEAVVLPTTEKGFKKRTKIQRGLDYECNRMQITAKIRAAVSMALKMGNAVFFCPWNKEKKNIDVTVLSSLNCYPDPMATNMDDCQAFFYAGYKNVGEIADAFPDKAAAIMQQASSPSDNTLTSVSDASDTDQVLYIEAYVRDYKTMRDAGDGKKTRAYPNGRIVKIAGDILLDDYENPYNDGKWPFVVYKCYDDYGRFWGFGEVVNIISPQRYASRIMNYIIDTTALNANSPWVVDKNCGIEKGSITARPGLVLRKTPGSEVRREPPQAIPAYVLTVVETMKRDIEVISGVFDVTRGESPGSITAASALNTLATQARGRIMLKVQNLEDCLSVLFQMMLSRMRQFWKTERTIRIVGKDLVPSFETMSKDDMDDDYDVHIVAGSSMEYDRGALMQQMLQLANTRAEDGLPMVDRKSLLELVNRMDTQSITERLEKQAKLMGESQAQQMAQEHAFKMQELQLKATQAQSDAQIRLADIGTRRERMFSQERSGLMQGRVPVDILLDMLGKMTPENFYSYVQKYPALGALLQDMQQSTMGYEGQPEMALHEGVDGGMMNGQM